MGIIALVRADFLKQRHTSYWGIHTVIPIAGATPSKATLVIVAVKTPSRETGWVHTSISAYKKCV